LTLSSLRKILERVAQRVYRRTERRLVVGQQLLRIGYADSTGAGGSQDRSATHSSKAAQFHPK
jgi:hypothetical protein